MRTSSEYRVVGLVGKVALAFIVTGTLACAMGPTFTKQTRFAWEPYDQNEYKQTKSNLTVEVKDYKDFPPSFYATVQACSDQGQLLVNNETEQHPVMEKILLAADGQVWYQVAITNQTGHVINLNRTVVRLFDPAGNQHEPMGKDDLVSDFLTNRPCPSSDRAANGLKLVKMIDRNTELLPDTTVNGWLAFKPGSDAIPGVWKLAVYEVPIGMDKAGNVTETTRFELRTHRKKFVDTYKKEGLFDQPKLVDSKEATD